MSLFVLNSALFSALHFKPNLLALAAHIDGAVVCFDFADEERYRGAWADANLPRSSGDNGEMFPKRTSSILVALYYFTSFFVLLYYYGWAYRVQHEQLRASGLGSALDVASLDHLVGILSFAVAIILALLLAGASRPSLGIVTGIVIAGMSVALRDMITNFVAGVLLLWDGSIKKGDVITIDGGGYGSVDRMSMRYTVIKDRSDVHTLIPHSMLTSNPIQNWTQDDQTAMSLSLLKFVGQASLVDDAMLPS